MRIRSIKPDYWAHKMHSVICESASLLGIALLNISDDEGYTDFTPEMIHGVAFPRRAPSRPVAALLDELKRVEYIGWADAVIHGIPCRIYRVNGFGRHQVISKPQPSRLAPHYAGAVHGLPPQKPHIDSGNNSRSGSGNHPDPDPGTKREEGRKEGRKEGERKDLDRESADAAARPDVNAALEYLNSRKEPEPVHPPPPESEKPSRAVFVPPTDDEMAAYGAEIGIGSIGAGDELLKFKLHYETNGWMAGRVKMKSWKRAMQKWIANAPSFARQSPVIIRGRR